MIKGKKIVLVMPAYNAEKTLKKTYEEIPHALIDDIILVDDFSSDNTTKLASDLNIKYIIQHQANKGYGANQKTCYKKALELEADIVLMLHADYQYTPLLIEAMVYPIVHGVFDVMLGSRILSNGALKGGMPKYKYIANRLLTAFQNLCTGAKLAEYHTGYRAYTKEVLLSIPFDSNSDNFIFDNEFLSQAIFANFKIGEITCPAKYFPEASSINLMRSIEYGMGVVKLSVAFLLQRIVPIQFRWFKNIKKKI